MKRFRRGTERAEKPKSGAATAEETPEAAADGVAVEEAGEAAPEFTETETAPAAGGPPFGEADAASTEGDSGEPEEESDTPVTAGIEPESSGPVSVTDATGAAADGDRPADVTLEDGPGDVGAELAAVEAELAAAGASTGGAAANGEHAVVSLESEMEAEGSDFDGATVEDELAAVAAELAAVETAVVVEPTIVTEATGAAEGPLAVSPAPTAAAPAPEPAAAPPLPPRRRDLPDLPPKPFEEGSRARGRWLAADGAWETTLRGRQVMNDPRLYRGVAFTEDERRRLGLVGLLPPQVIPLHEQLTRAIGQYHAQPTNLAKNVYLALLQDRNEVLYFRLLCEHLPEMLPVVYTPTVGEAIEHFSQEYRRPRGVFLSVDHVEDIEPSLEATGLSAEDVDLVVATDGEAILGIGDWGVGGINISLGKLALYTAAGGVDPSRTVAVVLDVGTNRQSLLDNPLYLGNRHERVDDATYDVFVDTFVEIVTRRFPNALLHWEDLAARNARRILERWGKEICTFNDDIQGTGSVALAAVLSGLRSFGGRLSEQRVVVVGPGTAGIGIAEQLRDAMVADGLDAEEARRRCYLVGRDGLLLESATGLSDYQRHLARPDDEAAAFERDANGQIGLNEVVRAVSPTILVGTSGQPGAFGENAIRNMALSCRHPIILPLSNPSDLVEAEPFDIMQWTGGRALVATGSPFDPVTYMWSTHYIGQANNAFVFPGLGLGVTLVGATRVTDHMLTAAAEAISAVTDMSIEGAPLLPEIDAIRSTSLHVAQAVGEAAMEDGVARWALPDPESGGVEGAMWKPEYRPIRAV